VVSLRREGESSSMSEFEDHVRQNQRRVFQIAYAVLGNAAEAEEIAQDAFLRAYRRLRSLREPERFRSWVGRIVYRLALNRRRSLLRERNRETAWQEAGASRPGSERERVDALFLDRVRREIDRLPEKLRSALVLCAIDGMEAAEAARILGVPEGTVRSRLHAARKRLLTEVES
jgi:RNA polymerase sigma-70 factor (ECF subfamily)